MKENPVTRDLKVMTHDDFRGDLFSAAKEVIPFRQLYRFVPVLQTRPRFD